MSDDDIGKLVKKDTLLLLTSGSYSSYSVIGVFRAKVDFTVPGKPMYPKSRSNVVDVDKIAASVEWVEELDHFELNRDY